MLKPIPAVVREYVYSRDSGRCRLCRRPVDIKEAHIHHVYSRFSVIPKDLEVPHVVNNNHPYNLITLCPECHDLLHVKGAISEELKRTFVKYNQELEYLKPFSKKLTEWLLKNEVR